MEKHVDMAYEERPASYLGLDLSQHVEKLETRYFAVGEVSDVYKCNLNISGLDQRVAVKVMRGLASNGNARKIFQQQLLELVSRWQTLDHPNLMPCFGTCNQFGPLPGLILPMCEAGSIMRFLEAEPSTSVTNRLDLLVQISAAVGYLHRCEFVHADIRGANIMISSGGVPLLMDTGLSSIVSRGDFTVAGICGRCRWMAPEVLDPPDDVLDSNESPYTYASDVYSLGMTILEIMSGKVPFNHRRYDTVVLLDVIRGIRPLRPCSDSSFIPQIWNILEACWDHNPNKRPTSNLVESWLNTARFIEISNFHEAVIVYE